MRTVTDSLVISRGPQDRRGCDCLSNVGVRCDAGGLLGQTARWSARQLALIAAFDALGLPIVSQMLHELPNLVVAVVILALALRLTFGVGGRDTSEALAIFGATSQPVWCQPLTNSPALTLAITGLTIRTLRSWGAR